MEACISGTVETLNLKRIMKNNVMHIFVASCGLLGLFMNSLGAEAGLSWQSGYSEQEINTGNVIAFWDFQGSDPLHDRSGNGHELTLRGEDTRIVTGGQFGGALEIRFDQEAGDHRQGASTPSIAALSPQGAFSLEMWIQPGEALRERPVAYLLDKKYLMGTSTHARGNRDYLLILRRIHSDRQEYRLEAELGFGEQSETVRSTSINLLSGEWQHVALTYDGHGKACLYLNGKLVGEAEWEGRRAITGGNHPLVIGDRYGSTGHRFPGKISQVRLTSEAVEFLPVPVVAWEVSEARRHFYRMEENAALEVTLTNDTGLPLRGFRARFDGVPDVESISIPDLKSNDSVQVKIPVNTALREGTYQGRVILESDTGRLPDGSMAEFEYHLYPRINTNRIPIVMWGSTRNPARLQEIGFTHYFAIWQGMGSPQVEFLRKDTIQSMRRLLDELLSWKLTGLAQISVGRNPPAQYARVDFDGKPHPKAINGMFPEVQQAGYDLGVFLAQNFGDLPGLGGALINTEIRDHTRPSFHEVDRQAWKEFSGSEIPEVVSGRARGISYRQIADFPARRVIPDDYPLLNYYRWFWKTGDGWNTLHTRTHEGVHTANRSDLWTWFDPGVRVPSIYGSGGDVDYLSQWTYTYPDPLKIALAGEELQAMSGGKPGQGIMNMTQVIWYRSQTAPIAKAGEERTVVADWEKENPQAAFITIAPDHLSQALWLKLSQPVQGIMYHGWGSLVGKGEGQTGYVGTNPLARQRLTELIRNVVEPLGPTLTQIPGGDRDVAFLQSYASQLFAGRGTYGWGNGWGADSWIVARYAGLEPKIVYEETIHEQGLEGYKLLFLTHCDVLTEETVNVVLEFQQNGGILIADEFLTPAIQPDILLSSYRRKNTPDQDKAVLQDKASKLFKELAPFYQLPVASNHPDVLLARRTLGEAVYLFAINDQRTYGDYVGHYRLVMEKGLPSTADIAIHSRDKVVYDLLAHQQVDTGQDGERTWFQVNLDAGEGRIYLCLDEAIGGLQVEGSSRAERGKSHTVKIVLKDRKNGKIPAVIPVQVWVRNSSGEEVEGTGYYGAVDGEFELVLDLAVNDQPGHWSVEVMEAATGQKTLHEFEVR